MSERPARFVAAVGSGKGGVGKSTASLHLVGVVSLDRAIVVVKALEQRAAA